jgi:hypothetical protein
MPDSPAVITWEAFTRSALLSLGLDEALIDFLACTAIGAAAVLWTLAFIAVRTSDSVRRRS